MSFTADRLKHLRLSLELALNQEWPQLQQTQRRLAQLKPAVIQPRPSVRQAMLMVATFPFVKPSLTVKAKESIPLKSAAGVYW